MSLSVTPEILEALNIEIDITRELQSDVSSWRYLYRWGKTVPEKNDAFNTKIQLLVEGRIGCGDPRESKGVLSVLKQKLLGGGQQRQTLGAEAKELQIRPSASKPEDHAGSCGRMQFFVVVDKDRTMLFQIRTDGAELQVDAGGFKRESIDVQQCYHQGAGLTGYVGVAKTRLRVTLKLFASKEAFTRPAVNATSFDGYNGISLPYYSVEGISQPNRVLPIRTHPYMDLQLRCPAIIANKLLVPENQFTAGVRIQLEHIEAIPGAEYVVQAELQCAEPWRSTKFVNEDGVRAMKVTQVVKTNARGRGSLCTLWDLQDEFGGFGLRGSGDALRDRLLEEGIPSPGEITLKLFQVTADHQLVYCGFCSYALTAFPGRSTQHLEFIVPHYHKAQQEKIYFMHSTFGAVPPLDRRVLLGLLTGNQRFAVQLTVETFHFVPSEDSKKIKEKMQGLQSLMHQNGSETGPGLMTRLMGLAGTEPQTKSVLDLRETVPDPNQSTGQPQQIPPLPKKPKPLVLGQGPAPMPKLKTQPRASGVSSTKLGEPSSDQPSAREPRIIPKPKPAQSSQDGKIYAPKLDPGKLTSLLGSTPNK